MRIFFTILISVVVGTLLSILVRNIIKRINKKIWKFSKIDTLVSYLPYVALFFAIIWITGRVLVWPIFLSLGAVGIISFILFNLMMLITLPFSWMIDIINVRIQSIKSKT